MTPPPLLALFAVLVWGVGCPSENADQPSVDVPTVPLPPPLVGAGGSSKPRAVDADPGQWSLSSDAEAGEHAPWLRLLYGQDLRGEIEACGCPGAPTGGFARRATVLAQARAVLSGLHVVEGPNALSRGLTGLELHKDQDRARARLIIEILGSLGSEALFPGQSDFSILPPAELAASARDHGLPVVVSNLEPSVMPSGWSRSLVWEIEGRRVMVLGLLGNPRTDVQTRTSPVIAPQLAVSQVRAEAGTVDVVVAFTSATERERRRWEQGGALDVDILLVPFEKEDEVPERWREQRYELTADPLGRGLRRLDLVLSGQNPGVRRQPDAEMAPRKLALQEETWLRLARRRAELATVVERGEDPRVMVRGYDDMVRADPETDPHAVQQGLANIAHERNRTLVRAQPNTTARHVAVGGVLVLPADVPRDPAVVSMIDGFQAKWLAAITREVAAAQADGVQDGRLYAGVDVCVGCHPAEYGQWGRTAHTGAYKTLREHAEHRNPDCLTCHSTGFGEPGGFADPSAARGLLNVQCEACHGPMAQHAREGASGGGLAPSRGVTVTERTCEGCHDPVNSPEFDYAEYLPRVAHGTRGAPGGPTP